MKGYFEVGSVNPYLAKRGITQERYDHAVANGERWCSGSCKAFRPTSDFYRGGRKCKDCQRELQRSYHKRRKELGDKYAEDLAKARAQKRERRHKRDHPEPCHLRYCYGLEVEDYRAILARQNGHCALCDATVPFKNGRGRFLCVDHDHSHCKGLKACRLCVRGLLCSVCNYLVGMLETHPEKVQNAREYIDRNRIRLGNSLSSSS
jgi:hypothetical protein